MVLLQGYECRRLVPQDLETSLTPRVLGREIKKTLKTDFNGRTGEVVFQSSNLVRECAESGSSAE